MNPSSTSPSRDENRARLQRIAGMVQTGFTETHAAREEALRTSREVVRNSANSIRATHRGEYHQARELLDTVSGLLRQLEGVRSHHPRVYYAGFVEDAQKEFVEAHATLAFAQSIRLPGPADLDVGAAPYLNGLAEAVGEMRRFILDSLRRGDLSGCEEILDMMDEVYTVLVSMDFPEAVTRGLRRRTDATRGILERTRGDLTLALRQQRLEEKLAAFRDATGTGEVDKPSQSRA